MITYCNPPAHNPPNHAFLPSSQGETRQAMSSSHGAAHMRASLTHHMAEAFEEHNVANELLESMGVMEEAGLRAMPEQAPPLHPSRARACAMSFIWYSPLGMGLSQNLKIRASQILDMSCRVSQEEVERKEAFTAAAAALMIAAKVEPSIKSPNYDEWSNMCFIASEVSSGVGCGSLTSTEIEVEESQLLRTVSEALAAPTVLSWLDVFSVRFEVVLQGRTPVEAEDIARVVCRASALASDVVWQTALSDEQPPFAVALGCFILSLIAEGLIAEQVLCPDGADWANDIDIVLDAAKAREEQRCKQQLCCPLPPRVWGWKDPPRLMFPALLVAAGCDESTASRATCKVVELLSC
mmetsp:Transcript_73089/g.136600  ORF Transcript_73089/g.136600 Transcript_73089/m.136600 type:complete len:353 (+) Transcript_73089:201-1259(+)